MHQDPLLVVGFRPDHYAWHPSHLGDHANFGTDPDPTAGDEGCPTKTRIHNHQTYSTRARQVCTRGSEKQNRQGVNVFLFYSLPYVICLVTKVCFEGSTSDNSTDDFNDNMTRIIGDTSWYKLRIYPCWYLTRRRGVTNSHVGVLTDPFTAEAWFRRWGPH